MPSDEHDRGPREVPACESLRSLRRDVLDWINVCGLAGNPVYGDVAALEPFPVLWIAGSNSQKAEISRRRTFLEQLARLVGLAVRIIESQSTKPRIERIQRPRRPRYISKREKKILEVIKRGVEGRTYCIVVDNEGVAAPRPWIDDGWPGSYVKAYDSTGHIDWKKRIQDEKSRVLKKAKQFPSS